MGMAVADNVQAGGGEKGGKLYGQKKKSAIFIENDVQMCRSDIRNIG